MTSLEIPAQTLGILAQKWNEEWTGAYIQQIRAVHDNTFLIKIHTKEKNAQLLIALPSLAIESQRKWENMEEQPPIVNATKKIVDNVRIEKIEQGWNDRILVIHAERANIIIELFGGGNIIVTDEKNTILFVHASKEWKGRTLKMKEKYVPPQNLGEKNQLSPEEKKLGKQTAQKFVWLSAKNKQLLTPVFEKNSDALPLSTVFEQIEEKIVEAWSQPKIDTKLESQKQALRVNLERQQNQMRAWENEIAEEHRKGEWVYAHFTEVQHVLDAIQRGIKNKVSEKKIVEELQKKIPQIKGINTEKGTLEWEVNEK